MPSGTESHFFLSLSSSLAASLAVRCLFTAMTVTTKAEAPIAVVIQVVDVLQLMVWSVLELDAIFGPFEPEIGVVSAKCY